MSSPVLVRMGWAWSDLVVRVCEGQPSWPEQACSKTSDLPTPRSNCFCPLPPSSNQVDQPGLDWTEVDGRRDEEEEEKDEELDDFRSRD